MAEVFQPGQSYNIQGLEVLRVDIIHLRRPATEELTSSLGGVGVGDGRVLGVPSLYFLSGRRDNRIEELLQIFLPQYLQLWLEGPQALLPPPKALVVCQNLFEVAQ